MNFRGRKITAALLAGGALFSGAGIGSAIAANATQTDTTSTTRTQLQSTQTQRGHHQANPAVTAAVKTTLGVDDAALKASKDAKQTLTQLAATKGVAKADLVTAIANALKASKPANAPDLTDAQLTDMATHIADHVPGQKDRGPRGNDQMRAKIGAAVASTLGMSTAELQAAHKAGTSLATLASQKGVAKADVVTVVANTLKANKPANAPDLTDAQLTQMATDIVDGVHHGPGGPGGHGGPGGPGGAQSQARR